MLSATIGVAYSCCLCVCPLSTPPKGFDQPGLVSDILAKVLSSPVLDVASSAAMAAEVAMDASLLNRTQDFEAMGYFKRNAACQLIVNEILAYQKRRRPERAQLVMIIVFIHGGIRDGMATFPIIEGDFVAEQLGRAKKTRGETVDDRKSVLLHFVVSPRNDAPLAKVHLNFMTISADRPQFEVIDFQLHQEMKGVWRVVTSGK